MSDNAPSALTALEKLAQETEQAAVDETNTTINTDTAAAAATSSITSSERFTFQLISDIHLEFHATESFPIGDGTYARPPVETYWSKLKPAPGVKYLALLGDICTQGNRADNLQQDFLDFFVWCCERWRHVLFVYGNHCCYGSSMEDSRRFFRQCEQQLAPHFHFLDRNQVFDVPGTDVRILGATLWTKCKTDAPLNDFRMIRDFTPAAMHVEHDKDIAYFAENLERCRVEGKRAVCFSHHVPLFGPPSLPEEELEFEKDYEISGTDLTHIFNSTKTPALKMWAFGHTHWSCDFVQDGIRFVSNQHGYPRDPAAKYKNYVPPVNEGLVVELN